MMWDRILLGVIAALGLLLVLMPMYKALRSPPFSWVQAVSTIGLGWLAALVLALVFMMAFNLLSAVLPGLNPFATAAYESIDAGLFSFFVGLSTALAVVCWQQFLFLNSKRGAGLLPVSTSLLHSLGFPVVIILSLAALLWFTTLFK